MTSPPTFNLSPQQQEACAAIQACFCNDSPRHFRLGGFAGTGKTTILRYIADKLAPNFRLAICAPTGKAAKVLTSKGLPATTIHQLCYEKVSDRPLKFARKNYLNADLIICDEASMVNTQIFEDLSKFHKSILWCGDPGQLEPVGDDPRLMVKPDYTLTEIFRQAADNPIIGFATHVRRGGIVTKGLLSSGLFDNIDPTKLHRALKRTFSAKFQNYDQIIVGRNETRHKLNDQIRAKLGFRGHLPNVKETLIILKNNWDEGLVNGDIVTVTDIHTDGTYDLLDDTNTTHYNQSLNPLYFTREEVKYHDPDLIHCDFSYAITCHKSQGSEWDRVLVIDEAFGDNKARWRYTAITRAAKHLTYLI